MCFSASASFIASAALTGGSALAFKSVKFKRQNILALIVLLFAIQQASEGILWLTLEDPVKYAMLGKLATGVFFFFANVVWPFIIPFAAYLLEERPVRKRIISIFVAVGAALSCYLFYHTYLTQGFSSSLSTCGHIEYLAPVPYFRIVEYVYASTMILPFVFLSDIRLVFYGFLIALTFIAAMIWYSATFVSVWCFFAASVNLFLCAYLKFYKHPHK